MKQFVTLLFCASFISSYGQSGTFDPDFDGDGKVISNFSTLDDVNNKIVQLPNGKILVGGYQYIGGDNDFVLACYNPDGSLDNTFNGSGTSSGDINLSTDEMSSFAVQADGKIVCVGHTGSISMSTYDIAIMRFNATGGIDATFGTNGHIVIDVNGGTDEAYDVAIQPDGKIVVVGYGDMGFSNNSYESVVYRFNTDGTPDNTFSFDGKVITTVSSDVDLFRKVLLQPDGKIIGIGFAFTTDLNGTLVRYNADGTLDNTFGTSGKVITDYSNSNTDRLYGGSLQPDGKIITCGHAYIGSDYDFLVARYNADGTLDNAFGNGGFRTIDIGLTDDECFASTIQSDGKILLVGSHLNTAEYEAVCYRMNPDGTPDGNFNASTPFIISDIVAGSSDSYSSVAMQSDGKIIMCGTSIPTGSSDYSRFAVRILSGLTIGVAEFTKTETAPLLYPNPLKDIETLKYTLQNDEQISIVLLDGQGKLISTFVENDKQTKGDHEVELNLPTGLENGTYFIQIVSPKGKLSIKTVK